MLILTRRLCEKIFIGDDVIIEVLAVTGCQVKLGVTAPKNVSVHREEVYNRINYSSKYHESKAKEGIL